MSGRAGSPRRSSSLVSGVVVAVVVLAAALVPGCSGADDSATYEVERLGTGEQVDLESLRGRPALLVSWATWCKECDELLAGLQEFATSDAAEGIEVVAVNLDAASVEDEIEAKIAKHGLTTELWRDRRNRFKREFGALGVPTTVVIDAQGVVVGTFPGGIDFDDDELLASLDDVRSRS